MGASAFARAPLLFLLLAADMHPTDRVEKIRTAQLEDLVQHVLDMVGIEGFLQETVETEMAEAASIFSEPGADIRTSLVSGDWSLSLQAVSSPSMPARCRSMSATSLSRISNQLQGMFPESVSSRCRSKRD